MTTRTTLQMIPVDDLVPTPDNPRTHRNDAAFAALVESIRCDGILVPLIARPMRQAQDTGSDGRPPASYAGPSRVHKGRSIDELYDLRAGHRRLAAAKKVGLPAAPVIVMDLDDLAALRVTLKENLDRDNLAPLEEAAGVRAYLDRGLTHEQIAAEFGRAPGWVARRAQLLNLSRDWRECIANPEHWASRWPVTCLELVAALGSDEQARLLSTIDNRSAYLQAGRPEQLRDHVVADITHELKRAPWDLADATLVPKTGTCGDCPHRSGVNPLLWEGLEDNPKVKAGDRCLKPDCWARKARANAVRTLTALKDKHAGLVVLTDWQGDKAVQQAARKLKLPVHRDYEASECAKDARGAVPAVKLTPQGIGKRPVYVQVRASRATPPPDRSAPAAEKSVKELRAELAQRRQRWALEQWHNHLIVHAKAIAQKAPMPNETRLLLAVHVFGGSDRFGCDAAKTWLNPPDLAVVRQELFRGAIRGMAETVAYPGDRLPKLVELVHELDNSLLAGGGAPTLDDWLEKAAREIPEPAGWTEREAAEKPGQRAAPARKKSNSKPARTQTKARRGRRRSA